MLWIRRYVLPLTKLFCAVGLFLASTAGAAPSCDSVYPREAAPGWNENMDEKFRKGDWFDSEEFYKVFQGDPVKTRKLIFKWYRSYSTGLLKHFEGLPSEYQVLLIDPGIATRAESFAGFATARLEENPKITPREMRRLYSAQLGTSKVYRGLLLTAEEAANIRANGMNARALESPSVDYRLKREFDGDFVSDTMPDEIRQGFLGEVHSRLAGRFLADSMLLSTSKWIEVTSAAAWSPKGKELQPEKTFYLFEIEVPELSLLKLAGDFSQLNKGLGSWRYFETKQYGSDEKFRRSVEDPDFEIFIFGSVAPSAIKNAYRYDQRPPLWWPVN